MAKKAVNVFDELAGTLDVNIEERRRREEGAVHYSGARKEWTKTECHREMDVGIEDLLRDDYYLGNYNIWPTIMEELEHIWHLRCDFDCTLIRNTLNPEDPTHPKANPIKSDRIYALSFEHAERKMREKWPRLSLEADRVDVRRPANIHTVIIETPKGTGKDFEAALIIWLLTREYLIQDREEFFRPYNLDMGTTISINLMNRSEEQAKEVTFKEILPKMNCPFYLDYFPPQIDLETIENSRRYPSELKFPRNVVIFPGTGSAASGLGYCIGASVIDECNFMSRSSTGKQSIMGSEEYDAAEEGYADLLMRQESRFGAIRNGQMCYAGLTVGISSTRTKNDFTQKMKRRAEKNSGIYYVSQPFWERKPINLSGETFDFDVNNMKVLNPEDAERRHKALTSIPEGLEAE